jgi:hypothetical protein
MLDAVRLPTVDVAIGRLGRTRDPVGAPAAVTRTALAPDAWTMRRA